ncbi:hypothetical protein D9756_001145 [Leucocoprinus leucothites]|uniref:DUF6987 domain-containing protein n=1 Tax=Leucocoprinus leucothites TaxID=201217 RepID=A0A8H5GF00_9AGAR|nr:hypothetical protein D9756_001145 [Leucoagaricus leucothites]
MDLSWCMSIRRYKTGDRHCWCAQSYSKTHLFYIVSLIMSDPTTSSKASAAASQGGTGPKAEENKGGVPKGDPRTQEEIDQDNALADRLSLIIEDANERVVPICQMIRKHIENMEAKKEEDRDEAELVKQVKPLIEQAEKILNETKGAVHGADPDKRLTNKSKRNMQDHVATPSEQRLAEALKVLAENVEGTIQWAKDKLDSFPKAKRDLGPLLDALSQPLTQIVAGVGLLLAGVLNLLGRLLSGLGLDSLLKGIVAATGLDKIYKGLGLQEWLKMGKK